ncbi:hypothetical protein L6452_15701 [Arctium lappa]|uniref:Uncharacterized protein n=1 Tax=Arctium lappa TaxID=4217 RepID=A0ACB9CQ29_ARCLA|nr:hypothetical protein L6452_15701 [Arctium lappa]
MDAGGASGLSVGFGALGCQYLEHDQDFVIYCRTYSKRARIAIPCFPISGGGPVVCYQVDQDKKLAHLDQRATPLEPPPVLEPTYLSTSLVSSQDEDVYTSALNMPSYWGLPTSTTCPFKSDHLALTLNWHPEGVENDALPIDGYEKHSQTTIIAYKTARRNSSYRQEGCD